MAEDEAPFPVPPIDGAAEEEPEKKKRGRPRKVSAGEKDAEEKPTARSKSRGRGRPSQAAALSEVGESMRRAIAKGGAALMASPAALPGAYAVANADEATELFLNFARHSPKMLKTAQKAELYFDGIALGGFVVGFGISFLVQFGVMAPDHPVAQALDVTPLAEELQEAWAQQAAARDAHDVTMPGGSANGSGEGTDPAAAPAFLAPGQG